VGLRWPVLVDAEATMFPDSWFGNEQARAGGIIWKFLGALPWVGRLRPASASPSSHLRRRRQCYRDRGWSVDEFTVGVASISSR